MKDFEKLGVFYLGKRAGPDAPKDPEPVLYDAKDLTTHGVIVGMTGSGKTGLGIGLIEEAALDGIPTIAVDPKGDLGNLLLTFPNLAPADFAPWVEEGVSAEETAAAWAKGLAAWGEGPERIKKFRDAVDLAIYTPGSSAGRSISILSSLAAPSAAVMQDEDARREKINGTVSGLLALLSIEADPLRSREHILVATLVETAWSAGRDLDLAGLIRDIQKPPFVRVGVVDVESFYPAKDRAALAMSLNNLLASPGFAAWLSGDALDVQRLLYTAEGRPRVSILSIAHLSDSERMFFVTLLLNEIVAWMRGQTGTSSLRALFYMDEVFGFFPPVANPPAKTPMLTLLKQARAYGLGCVLSTQNPVDLDYKGLSNAGTWFLGRLQTERDKARVLEGLEGVAAGASQKFDRARMEQLLAGLGNRVFLLNNVHEDAPEVFETRWALSYLRGPLTRAQIKTLMDPQRVAEPKAPAGKPPVAVAGAKQGAGGARPVLPPDIPQLFAPLRGSGEGVVYRAAILGLAQAHFADAKSGVASTEDVARVAAAAETLDWAASEPPAFTAEECEAEPVRGAGFELLAPAAGKPKSYEAWGKDFATWIYRERTLDLFRSGATGTVSKPGESEADFRSRIGQGAREARDAAADKLRQKYGPRIAALQERRRRAEQTVSREKQEATQAGLQTVISVGATVLGALFGRKTLSATTIGKATTAARGAGRTMKQAGDVGRAQESVGAIDQQIEDLDAEFQSELAASSASTDPATERLETLTLRPKKTDITVRKVALVWLPYRGDDPAFG